MEAAHLEGRQALTIATVRGLGALGQECRAVRRPGVVADLLEVPSR